MKRMSSWLVMSALLVIVAALGACTPAGNAASNGDILVPPHTQERWACGTSHTAGDLSQDPPRVSWTDFLEADGFPIANRAQGGAAFSHTMFNPKTIGYVCRAYLNNFPDPEILVVEGGANDIAGKKNLGTIKQAIMDLSSWLAVNAPDTTVVWPTVPPGPADGLGPTLNEFGRQLLNQWFLESSGTPVLNGQQVIDCEGVLEDPSNPGFLNPDFDQPDDNIHMNTSAGVAFKDCIKDSGLINAA